MRIQCVLRACKSAARAPQKNVVGRQATGKAPRVVDQDIADMINALDQADVDPVGFAHRREIVRIRIPDKTVRSIEIDCLARFWCQRFHRAGEPGEFCEDLLGCLVLHGVLS